MAKLKIMPCTFREAHAFVRENHRHNKPPAGHKFSIACYEDDRLSRCWLVWDKGEGFPHKSPLSCTNGSSHVMPSPVSRFLTPIWGAGAAA